MKNCANCKFLGQNYSKLNQYQQSIANPEEDYTCESGKGFSPGWLFGNPTGGSYCGEEYHEPNPDKEAVAKVIDLKAYNRQRIIEKILNRKME